MRNPEEEPAPVETEAESEEKPECSRCGGSDVELHEVYDGGMFCDDCSSECEGCGSRFPNSEMVETEDGLHCKECVESDFSKCEGCDKIVKNDDLVKTVEGLYCQQCVDDDFSTCESCNKIVLSGDTSTVQPNDQTWCERCVEQHASRCADCGETFDDGETSVVTLSDTGEQVCQGCYDNSEAFYCTGCEEHFSSRAYGGSNDNGSYCTNCYEEQEGPIAGYHGHKRRWNRFGKAADGVYYGVELEAINEDGYSDFAETAETLVSRFGYVSNKEFLFTEDDSSLHDLGFETIMHPMSPEFIRENREMFKKILDFMTKNHMISYDAGKRGVSAGMHITMTWEPFSKSQRQKFLQLIFQNRSFTTTVSRRVQADLDRYARVSAPAKISAMVMKKEGYDDKFRAVHLKSIDDNEGVTSELAEVRIFRGTLKLESFLMNLEYVMACASFARDIRFGFKDTTKEKFLAYVSEKRKVYPNLYAWLKEKRLIA